MAPRRSLTIAAAAATAITLAGVPSMAFAAGASASPHKVHPHSVKGAMDDPPTDAKVTTTVTGLPTEITAGAAATPLTVTYTNTGTTNYAVSALSFGVINGDGAGKIAPADFTVNFTYPGGASSTPAAGDCAQDTTTDTTYSEVTCYLDPGEDLDTTLAPNASIAVQVNLSFRAGYTADVADIDASAVLYATDDANAPEVDGAASAATDFSVVGDSATVAAPNWTPAILGQAGIPLPALVVR